MRLNELKDNPGANKLRVRVGRGIGSGVGKTGGRGVKGQKSRAGVSIGGFEGGQMPLYRRLPKRGFDKWRQKDWNELSLGRLQQAIDAGRIDPAQPIDVAGLVAAGVLRRPKHGVRLLGTGELKAKVEITVNHATASARAAVEKAGGKVNLIEEKVLEADEEKRKKSAAKKAASGKGTKSGE
ncbi:MAG TPA: 50S ribosomal protein L15 [Hyphomicrobiaceae bacterium]|jgi:large subunit ribosomal protein L15